MRHRPGKGAKLPPKAKDVPRKKISYELISPNDLPGEPMYAMLEDIIRRHHDELYETKARIALAWALSWKADVDGRTKLGQCKKASDLDRELHGYDFVIMLNMEFWHDAKVSEDQRRALLDHEISHATVKLDAAGDFAIDTKGRWVYRMRKHDIEEFSHIVGRYGVYKKDLEIFAMMLRRAAADNKPIVTPETAERVANDPAIREAVRRMAPKVGGGIESVTVSSGGKSVTLTQEDRARMDAEKRSNA